MILRNFGDYSIRDLKNKIFLVVLVEGWKDKWIIRNFRLEFL